MTTSTATVLPSSDDNRADVCNSHHHTADKDEEDVDVIGDTDQRQNGDEHGDDDGGNVVLTAGESTADSQRVLTAAITDIGKAPTFLQPLVRMVAVLQKERREDRRILQALLNDRRRMQAQIAKPTTEIRDLRKLCSWYRGTSDLCGMSFNAAMTDAENDDAHRDREEEDAELDSSVHST